MARRRNRLLSLAAVLATLLGGLGLALLGQGSAQAHGVAMMPGSRTYLCYLDAKTTNGALDPSNPACKAALAESGATALYNWFAVLDSNAAGRGAGYVPDGKLCSAGDKSPYNFTGYNAARSDWPRTHLTSGATIRVKYSNWAAHPGDFRVYVSKPGYSPSTELGWDDLELIQTVTNPPQSGSVGSESGHYYWDLRLPSGRSGNAVMFIQWVRSDSPENFFSCSDIVFDGGNGEVTGIGDDGGDTDPTPTPDPTDPHTGECMAVYSVTSSWNGGFQGSVEVMNHGTAPLNGWAVRWQPGTGTTISSVWNGRLSPGTDGTVTVRNADYNATVPADGSVTFGFTATSTGNDFPVGTIGCVNP
ncbi:MULTISPECIES: lytic polysaccharide monooxygenase [Streptomyces]|uniref:Lytic polysaccharide monooxygenase n=1 Tax=Streptomyces fuscus TaxID=3048495 RepID=A0ABT7J680_9ACTN|nr:MULTISPECIES: lytic polysaccharide monooxygenase [Streptomyces]MCM1975310.1 lytic polysaccharide monooxygenase [Streptomyces sp. G1]MDL2080374.1 lytic polysaccharide monooxygenase [Streptomyces fuscus]SBT88864.1 chitin-binding protein [Streptomyces sp. DI166]